MSTILILGGAGGVGRALAPLLLQVTAAHVVLAGRTMRTVEGVAADLNHSVSGHRVTTAYADAADTASLRRAFNGVDMVVVASSTTRYVAEVAGTAMEMGIDYLDVQYSPHKIATLKSLAEAIRTAGRCFITDAGFHPGLPAALIRYLAPRFDQLQQVRIGSVIRHDFSHTEIALPTVQEFLDEISDFEALAYRRGQWTRASLYRTADYLRMDFGDAFGIRWCAPMFLEELRDIPARYPSVADVGFFVSGFNWFVDWVVLPLAVAALRVGPRRVPRVLTGLAAWGLRSFSRAPFGTVLKAQASGRRDGRLKSVELILRHDDAYAFTAIPVAACLLQYLDGSIRRPGLWLQALAVEPNRLIEDMGRMGVRVDLREGMR